MSILGGTLISGGYVYSFCYIFQGVRLLRGLRLFQTLEYTSMTFESVKYTVCYLNNYHDIALCATKLKNALDARYPKRDRTNIKQKLPQKSSHKIGDSP